MKTELFNNLKLFYGHEVRSSKSYKLIQTRCKLSTVTVINNLRDFNQSTLPYFFYLCNKNLT